MSHTSIKHSYRQERCLRKIRQAIQGLPPTPSDRIAEILETLVTLGQARQTADGRFVG